MSRYRWLSPSRSLETMDFFPSMKDLSYAMMQKHLFDAVSRGDIRALLNDEVVPKAHIGTYLTLYEHATPTQEANTLPPNLGLNYDDLRAVFDRPAVDNRKRGRPTQELAGWSEDRRLAHEMHRMLSGDPSDRQAKSASDAARKLVAEGRVPGAGTPENRAKRLVNKFRKYYSS